MKKSRKKVRAWFLLNVLYEAAILFFCHLWFGEAVCDFGTRGGVSCFINSCEVFSLVIRMSISRSSVECLIFTSSAAPAKPACARKGGS